MSHRFLAQQWARQRISKAQDYDVLIANAALFLTGLESAIDDVINVDRWLIQK